jgi:hypothetical protein
MEIQPDPKQLSRFLGVSAVMVALFLLACSVVAAVPWLLNTILGRD